MIYLQKVIAFVKSEKCLPELETLGKVLQKAGIIFQCFQGEDIAEARMPVNYSHKRTMVSKKGQTVGEESENRIFDGAELEARLWITDCARWAASLRLQQEPVLVLLHEENREQNFSGIMYACENVGELDAGYMEQVYKRYVNLPWDITETDRCVIRETTEEDVDAFWQIYSNSEITRYTEGLYPTIEKEKQYAREYREKVYGFYGFGVWTIVKKDTGEIIGRAGFSYREGYEDPEIGFVIGVPWQRQGYAYEVCSALLQYAGEKLAFERITAFVRPENEASLELCRKLGMETIGEAFINGQSHAQLQKELL